jgi:archaellum component FlaC
MLPAVRGAVAETAVSGGCKGLSMAQNIESMTADEVKKLGEECVATEVKRLKAEWKRLSDEFIPFHDQLANAHGSDADMERRIAERSRLVEELEAVGNRLIMLQSPMDTVP